jgi:hypothetical protein
MSSNALLWPSQGTKPEERLDKYKYLRLPSQGIQSTTIPDDWFDTTWKSRIPIVIKAGQVPSTQNDFPFLVNSTIPELIGKSSDEIRFAGIDKVQLDYEIPEFNSINGEIISWSKKPVMENNEITYLYFNNPSAIDEQNSAAVYDANYKGVYHLNGVGTDSTSNGLDLTKFGTTTVAAKIGDGIDFPGLETDYLIRNPYNGFPSTAATSEFWIETTDIPFAMFQYATIVNVMEFSTFFSGGSNVFIQVSGDLDTFLQPFNDGNFHHIVVTWRSSDGQLIFYLDGVNVFSTTQAVGESLVDGGAVVLGQEQDSVGGGFNDFQALDGIMDEVRLSDISRSADYVTTSFRNQNDPSSFYSILPVQNIP